MGILSTNYPIRHRVVNGPYTVSQYDETADETQEIYKGNSYTPGTGSDLDLSEITRYHLNTHQITLPPFGDPVVETAANVKKRLRSVFYGNGKWVAVGYGGLIATSTDGVNWKSNYIKTLSSTIFFSVTYGNGVWVIGGSGPVTGYSLDNALTWEFISHKPGTSNSVSSLTYANGLFIGYHPSGMFSSPDGINWHIALAPSGMYSWYKSYYVNSIWYSLGHNGAIRYSEDNGLTWTFGPSIGSSTRYEAVKIGDKYYVVGKNSNNQGTIEVTTDFTSFQTIWTGRNPYNSISYGNNVCVITGSTGYLAYSQDLKKWQEQRISDRNILENHFDNNKFTFVGDYLSGVSTNGIDWQVSFYNVWNFITRINNLYIGGTNSASMFYSTDGVNFNTSVVGDQYSSWQDIAYGNGLYVLAGAILTVDAPNKYDIALSTDGKNWTPYFTTTKNRYGITFGQDKFISVGNNGIQSSTDGLSWTTVLENDKILRTVTYANEIFIAAGDEGELYYSSDGITWNNVVLNDFKFRFCGFAFGHQTWIGMAGNFSFVYSTDNGISWTRGSLLIGKSCYDITYHNGQFIAVGWETIAYSNDGINWEIEEHPETIKSIYAKDNTLILAGEYFYEFRNVDYGISTQDTGMIADFVIDNNSRMYTIGYDYNTEGIEDIGYNRINNDPISNELIEGGYATLSFYDAQVSNNKEITVTLNGRKLISDQSPYRATQFYFFTEGVQAQPGDTLTLSIESNGQTYSVDYQFIDNPEDHRYAIYYVNKLGGVDGLLLKGRVDESFTNSSYQISTPFDKSNPADFQNQTIQNTAKRKFSVNTGFLTDQQSGRMDHLMLSPKVWLFDIRENKRYACTIKSNSFTRKRFRNGHKLVNYTLELEQSQEIIRRS